MLHLGVHLTYHPESELPLRYIAEMCINKFTTLLIALHKNTISFKLYYDLFALTKFADTTESFRKRYTTLKIYNSLEKIIFHPSCLYLFQMLILNRNIMIIKKKCQVLHSFLQGTFIL